MNIYIALLRGINVGGQKKVPMLELRQLLSESGLKNVQTYIQSGNVVFQSSEENKTHLENSIQNSIKKQFGFDVPVLVKTHGEIMSILKNCPFSMAKKESSYFTLLHDGPDIELVSATSKEIYPNEEFNIKSDCVYFYSEMGYGNAKCNNNFFERKLKVDATTRNYKTMLKLLSLLSQID